MRSAISGKSNHCWFKSWPHSQRARTQQRKRKRTPDRQVAVLKSKGIYMWVCDDKMSRSLRQPTGILKVYTKALTGFSHVFNSYGLKNTLLSDLCPLNGYGYRKGLRTHIPGEGQGETSWTSDCTGLALESKSDHTFSMISPNHKRRKCQLAHCFMMTWRVGDWGVGWERGAEGKGYMYTYSWFTVLYSRN